MASSRNIVVADLVGSTIFSGEVAADVTVKTLKSMLETSVSLPPSQQKLICGSVVLKPASAIVSSLVENNTEDHLRITLITVSVEEVYFFGLSWGRLSCGISAKHCRKEGDVLNNSSTQDRFIKTECEGGFRFESVSVPGLYFGALDGPIEEQKVALIPGECRREVFKQVPAINDDVDKISLESVAFPGRFICHYYGVLYCHSRDQKLAGNEFYFNDCSWHIAEVEQEDEDEV
eukprot:TRINITY_DN41165_c0_g1_i2.p1 TRINITY_DN41165_c0_g1~~TRINITY_DN41165_c0_g1_i2.p1  ORF type:complete len:233 (+),score=45.51 TRINITY_DN41165_c0_g1_i2:48-746(+)